MCFSFCFHEFCFVCGHLTFVCERVTEESSVRMNHNSGDKDPLTVSRDLLKFDFLKWKMRLHTSQRHFSNESGTYHAKNTNFALYLVVLVLTTVVDIYIYFLHMYILDSIFLLKSSSHFLVKKFCRNSMFWMFAVIAQTPTSSLAPGPWVVRRHDTTSQMTPQLWS